MAMQPVGEPTLEELQMKIALMEQAKTDENNFAIGSAPQALRESLFRDYDGETGALDQQIESANALRDGAPTQGVRAGNAFVASSPWSAVADIAKQGTGIYKGNQARDARAGVTADRASSQMGLADHRHQMQQEKLMQQQGMQEKAQQAQAKALRDADKMQSAEEIGFLPNSAMA